MSQWTVNLNSRTVNRHVLMRALIDEIRFGPSLHKLYASLLASELMKDPKLKGSFYKRSSFLIGVI